MHLDTIFTTRLGQRGIVSFSPGWYVYNGSAQLGVEARVARHLSQTKKTKWHIDYLLPPASLAEVWVGDGAKEMECSCARAFLHLAGASIAVPGFGSSDCRCPGHLVRLPSRPSIDELSCWLETEKANTNLRALTLPESPP